MKDELAKLIKENREALELTQAELAEKLGVSKASVANWEQGRNKPSKTVLLLLDRLVNDR